jgi:hypothetical protein
MAKMEIRKFDVEAFVIGCGNKKYFVVNTGIVGAKKKQYRITELDPKTNASIEFIPRVFSSMKEVKLFIN